jgi:hypothetical protein
MLAFILITTFIMVMVIVLLGGWVIEQSYDYPSIPETELERKATSLKKRYEELRWKLS